MDKFLSKYHCGFIKGFNAQDCFFSNDWEMEKEVDNGNAFGALLTDLSKAFDCLPLDLIISKLGPSVFNLRALNLIDNYLTKR